MLLQGAAVGSEYGVVFLKPLDGEGVVRYYTLLVEHLAETGGVSASRGRHVVHQLVSDQPSGREELADAFGGFGCHLQRGLEVGLDDELADACRHGLLLEGTQDFHQLVADAHGQVGGQARAQSDALQFGIFLPFGARLVGFALALCHAADGVQDVLQSLVLAHQRIAARDEDVAQLGVLLEVGHQAAQLLLPAFLGAQFVELEIEALALEVVHALARGTKASAGTPHGVGDEDGHLGIAAVDVVPVGQEPSGSVGLARLHHVLALPGAYLAVGFHQLG